MASEHLTLPRLPACQRCYQRKAKCDSLRPQCASCAQSNTICLIAIPGSDETISRAEIHQLESEQRELAQRKDRAVPEIVENTQPDNDQAIDFHSPHSTVTVVDGSGPNFIKALFADETWRENNAHLLQSLAHPPKAAELSVQANPLPHANEARTLFDKYLTGSNVMCPVLLRSDVNALYSRVFGTATVPHPESEDSFRAFMILAIGAVVPHRKGLHRSHPFGYYLSAVKAFKPSFNPSAGLRCILDLLLITRFGVYYNIGVSIWDINQLCMRLCISQNLHRSSSAAASLLHEQLERRAFWECYIIDRYSSVVLGRPFAISDQEVTVSLPIELSDEQITAFEGQVKDLDSLMLHDWVLPSEMSVFCFCVRLRQISSRMRTLFSHANGHGSPSQGSRSMLNATGNIYAALDDLLGDLDVWRDSAPVFTDPQSLYEMSDWYDLLRARERLIFIRKAVDLVPKRSSMPPIDLLILCLHAAADMISKYADLFDRKIVTHTRSYYQTLFLAGLSILFCVSVLPKSEDSMLLEAYQALGTCERTLRELGANMPDASNFLLVFEALLHHVMQKRMASIPPSRDPLTAEYATTTGSTVPYQPAASGNTDSRVDLPASTQLGVLPTIPQHGAPGSLLPWLPHESQSGLGYGIPSAMADASKSSIPDEMLSWAFLQDDTIWNMEAGVGRYVYGEPNVDPDMLNGFHFNF